MGHARGLCSLVGHMNKTVVIVTPVFNDWNALALLVEDLRSQTALQEAGFELRLLAVDDGSVEAQYPVSSSPEVQVLRLNCNQGHQRAIAIGLAYVWAKMRADYAVVMDADGEDRPSDIAKLLAVAQQARGEIIFAERSKRHETLWFKISYFIYRALYLALCGKRISFGNFSVIPWSLLRGVVYTSAIWNHYAAGILCSRMPLRAVPIERGMRYAGHSRMNFPGLVIHGMSAIAVQTEVAATRIVVLALLMICVMFSGILVITGLRFFTTLAIPGWATSAVLGLLTIMIQCGSLALLVLLLAIGQRSQRQVIPAQDYATFIVDDGAGQHGSSV